MATKKITLPDPYAHKTLRSYCTALVRCGAAETLTDARKKARTTIPSEKSIQAEILHYLNEAGFFWKDAAGPYQQRGIPDIVGVLHGRFCAFEVKRPAAGRGDTPPGTDNSADPGQRRRGRGSNQRGRCTSCPGRSPPYTAKGGSTMTEPYTPSVKGAREDLRDWLRRYRTARNRKRDLDNRLKNVLADLNDPPLGGQGGGSPGSGTPSTGAAAIAYKIDEVEQHIKDQQGRMAQIFLETCEVIDLLPNIEDRQLLEKRYIDCQSWQQIEKDLYLARSNLARREASALDTLLQHKTVQDKLAAWLDGLAA